MPEKTVKRPGWKRPVMPRSPQMTVLYSQPSPSWSKRSSAPFPKERQNAELKKEAVRLGSELLRGTKYEQE